MTRVDGGATASYTYDAFNRRVEVATNGGASRQEIAYDPNGRRYAIWDGNTGALLEAETYWNGRPVAFWKNGHIHFQHQDWLGTERMRTSYCQHSCKTDPPNAHKELTPLWMFGAVSTRI